MIWTPEVAAWHALQRGHDDLLNNRFDDAIAAFDVAISLTPQDAIPHWNKALALLSLGDYDHGFEEFAWRWRLFDWRWGVLPPDIRRIEAVPPWRGEPLDGVSLLVQHEMGFGDAIMLYRYLPELIRRGADVTVLTVAELRRLARAFGVDVIETLPVNLDRYAYRVPLFDLARMLPVVRPPYMGALCPVETCRLGIAWADRGHQRGVPLDEFVERLGAAGARYEIQALQPGPVIDGVRPFEGRDFVDVAELVATCRHVVTVDTAAIHVAGALAHPSAHVLIPHVHDWRWWRPDYWYPQVNVHRQTTPDDWGAPFARVNEVLLR